MVSLGIDLGGTFARAAVVDGSGVVLASAKSALQERSPDGVCATIVDAAKRALDTAGLTRVATTAVSR